MTDDDPEDGSTEDTKPNIVAKWPSVASWFPQTAIGPGGREGVHGWRDWRRDVRTVRSWRGPIPATVVDRRGRGAQRRQGEAVMGLDDRDTFPAASEVTLGEAVWHGLHKLLLTLDRGDAEVIRRVDLLGEPQDRVAASLGVTVSDVTLRLHRGRQALKRRLVAMCLMCPVHGSPDCRCKEAERARRRWKDA